ncbi:MAG: tetratricopeptide repeat protein [Elusimicrobia bacterium]|nr:tetratricopeptide repeat protein [Elusimicrobiota bacterium]
MNSKIHPSSFSHFILFLCISSFILHPSSLVAQTADNQAVIQQHYDQAFLYYRGGDYGRAIQKYNEILKLDPEQRSAKKMIEDARGKVESKNKDKIRKFYKLIEAGKYQKALLDLQFLLDQDPTHPKFVTLQGRLEKIIPIVPQASDKTQAWQIVLRGLKGYLGKEENLRLAYNGLRYSQELDPKDSRISKLLALFTSEHPEMARTDEVTPGMKFMEYKRFVSLNYIYDGKYHLAVDTLNEILDLEPRDIVSLKRLGSSYFGLGHKDRAQEVWTSALKLSPNDKQLKKFLEKVKAAKKSKNTSESPSTPQRR